MQQKQVNVKMICTEDYRKNEKEAGKALDAYTENKLGDNFCFKEKKVSFIYKEDDNVVGRIVGSIFFNYLQIEMVVVDDRYHGKGIGGQLLAAAEKTALEEGCIFVYLESMSFNAPGFYEKKGYKIIEKVENSPLPGESHYFFIKHLKNPPHTAA
ncbi:GNAT family N-acetyltransferase [Pectobacterium punjabense]|uniref:GNAT family N-acetyltransferase n=1 Tax=Pectobacterium punjabense TaxID=2108399 RepID=UPI002B24D727|nr:GNAT family N-acetyltransferase [Pectobacterium punjabense]